MLDVFEIISIVVFFRSGFDWVVWKVCAEWLWKPWVTICKWISGNRRTWARLYHPFSTTCKDYSTSSHTFSPASPLSTLNPERFQDYASWHGRSCDGCRLGRAVGRNCVSWVGTTSVVRKHQFCHSASPHVSCDVSSDVFNSFGVLFILFLSFCVSVTSMNTDSGFPTTLLLKCL